MKDITSKIIIILLIFVFVSAGTITYAESSSTDVLIEDTYGYFSQEEISVIEQEVLLLPEVYRFIVLPSIDMGIKDMAEFLFEHRGFSQDTILILLLTDDKQIYITTGEALQKKELNEEFFHTEIDKYFFPSVNDKSIAQALLELTKGISNDIPEYLAKEKSSIKIPNPVEESQDVEVNESTMYVQQIILVGAIILFIVILWIFFSKGNNKRK